MSEDFRPLPFTVIGMDMPDDGNEASILGTDFENNKLAISLDFASFLALLEYSTKAVEVLGFRQTGKLPHIPASASVNWTQDAPEKVALGFRFGTIGVMNLSLSHSQAEELARGIESVLAAARK